MNNMQGFYVAICWLFIILSLSLHSFSKQIKLSTHSIFYPKPSQLNELINDDIEFKPILLDSFPDQTHIEKEIEVEKDLELTHEDIRICLNRVIQKEYNDFKNDARIVTTKQKILISQISKPMGWNHFPFEIRLLPRSIKFPVNSILEIASQKVSTCFMPLIFQLKENTIKILSSEYSLDCSNSEVEVFNQASNFIIEKFEEELNIHKIRKKQQASYKESSNKLKQEQLKKKLHDIINPDKKSRKKWRPPADSCGSSGRYTPSESTRARRQVKSK